MQKPKRHILKFRLMIIALSLMIAILLIVVSIEFTFIPKTNNFKEHKQELKSFEGFPTTVTNLSIVNSEYDDYNSALTGAWDRNTFIFSSNRNSKGKKFDIIQYNALLITYTYINKIVTISIDTSLHDLISSSVKEMLKTINTQENEFGPYIYNSLKDDHEFLLFYAQEKLGKLNIKFMVNKLDSIEGYTHYYNSYGPYDANLINKTKYSDAYISIQNSNIYFCSDINGNYDIYQYPIDTAINTANEFMDFLTKKSIKKHIPIKNVNSDSDDKCPYIINDLMVFSSNRKGGFGGYDLWYSRLINNIWTEPVNFGLDINSQYDEYRPIVKTFSDFPFPRGFPDNLMIFSSNRPGGKGGFDLYYVGLKKILKQKILKIKYTGGNT